MRRLCLAPPKPTLATLALATLALLTPIAASASETITYSYDAKGRLTKVVDNRWVTGDVVTSYAFDAADNRTSVTTTGAWLDPGAQRVVVTPLPAGAVIALPNP